MKYITCDNISNEMLKNLTAAVLAELCAKAEALAENSNLDSSYIEEGEVEVDGVRFAYEGGIDFTGYKEDVECATDYEDYIYTEDIITGYRLTNIFAFDKSYEDGTYAEIIDIEDYDSTY